MTNFKKAYIDYRSAGYSASFIQKAIAKHCFCSVYLVRGWANESVVIHPRSSALLVSFDPKNYKLESGKIVKRGENEKSR